MQLAELAALLFLSEYTHARHLWRRHETAATSPSASRNPELHQFQLLWTAAQPMATHDHAGAYAALDSCIASAAQPLAAYAGEIRKHNASLPIRLVEEALSNMTDRVMLAHEHGAELAEDDLCTLKIEDFAHRAF